MDQVAAGTNHKTLFSDKKECVACVKDGREAAKPQTRMESALFFARVLKSS